MSANGFLQTLRNRMAEYYVELDPLLKEKERLEETINQIQQCIEHIKLLEQAERTRLGEVPTVQQPPIVLNHRFESMTLREACRTLLKENKRMSRKELESRLEEGGFNFGKAKPGRMIHFALAKDPLVKKLGDGTGRTYIWQEDKGEEH